MRASSQRKARFPERPRLNREPPTAATRPAGRVGVGDHVVGAHGDEQSRRPQDMILVGLWAWAPAPKISNVEPGSSQGGGLLDGLGRGRALISLDLQRDEHP